MSNPNFTFLNGSAARHANLLTTANAEAGTGWTNVAPATVVPAQTAANSIATPFNGWDLAVSSAWAFGSRLAPGAGGYYTASYGSAYDANIRVVSCFVRTPQAGDAHTSATPATTFRLATIATGNVIHGHQFAWDAGSGSWITGSNINGGRGVVLPEKYADGWQRVLVAHQYGWDPGYAETGGATDTYNVYTTCQNNKNVDVWGLMLETQTAIAVPATAADLTAATRSMRPLPYLDGLGQVNWDSDLGPLGFQPPRARYHKGVYQVKSTVIDTTFELLQRVSGSAPFESAQATVFANLNADFTKTYAIEVYPEYRLAITALAATGVQGAWLAT